MIINAFAVNEPKGKLQPFQYSANLKDNDVLIKISHCALGKPDIFFIDNFWGDIKYPLVPGYEIIGKIESLGKNVTNFKVGDRIGAGYQVNSCGHCEYCQNYLENLCQKSEFIEINHYGGLADKIIINNRFIFKIPDSLDSTKTTPLMCSGLTPYATIMNSGVKSGMNTGVIGIGALGHLAVKILDKMNCTVTAFSSNSKKNLKKILSFDNFVENTNIEVFKKLERRFDFILSTVYGEINWDQYIKLLKPQGTLAIVGLPPTDIHFPAASLNDYSQRIIRGGFCGSCQQMRDLLDFAAKHKIEAEVEEFPLSQVNKVLDKIRNKEILFKAVITI